MVLILCLSTCDESEISSFCLTFSRNRRWVAYLPSASFHFITKEKMKERNPKKYSSILQLAPCFTTYFSMYTFWPPIQSIELFEFLRQFALVLEFARNQMLIQIVKLIHCESITTTRQLQRLRMLFIRFPIEDLHVMLVFVRFVQF